MQREFVRERRKIKAGSSTSKGKDPIKVFCNKADDFIGSFFLVLHLKREFLWPVADTIALKTIHKYVKVG